MSTIIHRRGGHDRTVNDASIIADDMAIKMSTIKLCSKQKLSKRKLKKCTIIEIELSMFATS